MACCLSLDLRLGGARPAPPTLVDHARRHGVRRPVMLDSEQKSLRTAARFYVHEAHDRSRVVEELDQVVHRFSGPVVLANLMENIPRSLLNPARLTQD